MKNKLAYLGFLGLLGFGGLIIQNTTLFSFFPFFIFFSYANVIPDELFWDNVKKSALHAFIVQTIISTIIIAAGSFFAADLNLFVGIMIGGLCFNYGIGILIFALNLAYYENREKKG